MRAGSDMRHLTITMMREDLPRASLDSWPRLEAFAPTRPLLESELPEMPRVPRFVPHPPRLGHLDRRSRCSATAACRCRDATGGAAS